MLRHKPCQCFPIVALCFARLPEPITCWVRPKKVYGFLQKPVKFWWCNMHGGFGHSRFCPPA